MDHQIDIELVKNYVNGTLSQEHREQIEAQLAEDPTYAHEFNQLKEIVESITLFHHGELKKKLQSEDRSTKDKSHSGFSSRRWLAMAASLVLIAVSGYFLFFSDPSPQEVYEDFYQPYYNVLSTGERGPDQAELDAVGLYEQGRYQEALEVFEQQIVEEPDNSALIFYQGLNYLALEQSDQAIGNLQAVIDQSGGVLTQPAQWYLGLAYLQKGDLENARSVFETLLAESGAYQQEASDILQKLP